MKAYQINLLNSLTLIIIGLWGVIVNNPEFLDFKFPEPTAFIPVVFGLIFLMCYNGIKNENKVISHIVVLLTLLVFLALAFKTLPAQMTDDWSNFNFGDPLKDFSGVCRVSIMAFTSLLAFASFIKSFISNRKKS